MKSLVVLVSWFLKALSWLHMLWTSWIIDDFIGHCDIVLYAPLAACQYVNFSKPPQMTQGTWRESIFSPFSHISFPVLSSFPSIFYWFFLHFHAMSLFITLWHLATASRTSTSEMQQQEKERLFSTSKCISGPLKNMICLFESDEKQFCHIPVATGAWELGGPFLWSNSNFFQSCKLQSCGSWADVWRLVKIRGFSAISLCFFSGFALLWL